MDDRCEECGYDARQLSMAGVAAALEPMPAQVGALVAGADPASLRVVPASGGWSALGYLVHLRDLTSYHRWLIEQALAGDSPAIGSADPDAAVAAVDLDAIDDPGEVVAQFDRRVRRLVDLLATLEPAALDRTVRFEPSGRVVDVRLLARSALHEAVHHHGDLQRLLA